MIMIIIHYHLFQKAFENGLVALVADGIHKLPPALGEHGQLYTIHGVCNGGIDIPLVHVLTEKKNQKVYEKVFGMLKQELLDLGADLTTLRIIIDFEKAALAVLKKCLPPECIQGCGFHLGQAWIRKAVEYGLKTEMKDPRIRRWWMTLKGLVFLSQRLHRKVPA
ncbi:hypothetical protein ANCDUO_08486 [Ancylostoma duodenale]|uniref:Uncharacterized protein n=1 Tax=Ancylostoma duodenale TaxID=51022 RepID=A0A0C2DFL7_9BILA|nr:hypothetical protein ANCDUO_08486 [Ancylostoma duodenale]